MPTSADKFVPRESRPTGVDPETAEQALLIQWARRNRHQHPELDLLFHIPNGGHRSRSQGAILKLAGVRAGVPDLFLPVPRAPYHGLWIEMKAGKGRPTPEQRGWLEALAAQGYVTAVCWGFEEAREMVAGYLGIEGASEC
jgi:hypothetical protein